jgi:ribosomal protein S15P/S13E
MQKKAVKKGKKIEVEKPANKKLSAEEYEKRVIELAKSGLTSEKIGEQLRKEGIHPKEHGKKISKILKDKELYVNSDLKNVKAKLENLDKHFQSNKQDKRALKDKERIHGKFRKLEKYFKRK